MFKCLSPLIHVKEEPAFLVKLPAESASLVSAQVDAWFLGGCIFSLGLYP